MQPPTWRPRAVDLEQAIPARVYDYILGGAHNFAVDREVAREAARIHPGMRRAVYDSRAFLRRAVQFCLGEGVRQFVDLGSGLPTAGNVHEVAHRVDPGTRVLYVDNDPAAVIHSRAMLGTFPDVEMVHADLCAPEDVLRSAEAARLLDFDQPIALCAVGLLDFVPRNDRPAEVLAKYRALLPAGSYLVLTHLVDELSDQPETERLLTFAAKRGWAVYRRSKEEVEALFAGLTLVDPGVVPVPLWRTDSTDHRASQSEQSTTFAGVGRLA